MKKTRKTNKKIFWVIFIVSILVVFEIATYISSGKFLLCGRYGNCAELNIKKESLANTVTYECGDKQFIQAQFYTDDTVNLQAYSNDKILIKTKLSTNGKKYISKDKSISFWIEADDQMSTFLEKDGRVILNCKFQSSGE